MGCLIVALAEQYGCKVVGEVNRGSNLAVEFDNNPDVCLDFTSPDSLLALCSTAAKRGVKVVSGTTGLSDSHKRELALNAKNIPILHASNFSIGVFVLNKLVKLATEFLPENFDIEIVERHHSKKKDAPSGTAITLLKNIQSVRHCVESFGRKGNCERSISEVCLHSVRGGDIVGEHEVLFAGQGERLELIHRITNREIFARGALCAAKKFAKFSQPGLYTLDDVL
jgi:4-hydroxy-tetrahydrodipicolinate reductase